MFAFRSSFLVSVLLLLAAGDGASQSASKPAPAASSAAIKATSLAEEGHCDAALPALEKVTRVADPELERKVGLSGVHCSMTLGRTGSALRFLELLERDFPHDPEALYVETHAYSDLSTRASQMLASSAPSSPQAHELLAESDEMEGKWDAAEKEYRRIVVQNPRMPGIHFRLGRLLLSRPNPSATVAEDAKQEFTQELAIDPTNAGAEYVLGELARQAGEWSDAIKHFSRATELDPSFSDAFLGLGTALLSDKQFAQAIPPLETAVKLDPRNPATHYSLATALTRAGRKEDAEKEFAIHRQMTQKGEAGPPPRTAEPQNPN
jgi:tetratricopeptide (TPR) repeat protein